MSTPYFQLLGHVYLAVHSYDQSSEVASAVDGVAEPSLDLERGGELLERGLELPDRRLQEAEDDRITEHNLHSSASEVEMWLQTTRFEIKQAVDDPGVRAKTFGVGIEVEDHVVEVVARAVRMISMIRTNGTLHDQYGTGRKVKDTLIRGNNLLKMVLKDGDDLMRPGSAEDPDAEVFEDIRRSKRELIEWVDRLAETADKLRDRPEVLGELGYVPEGVGLPVGGTGYGITLHERSHRNPPDPDEKEDPDPGWTIGRQGRNSENMGKGWLEG
ncbi:MAG: hypothetical protein ABEL76_10025 [Bradymonadaceae bacterium]